MNVWIEKGEDILVKHYQQRGTPVSDISPNIDSRGFWNTKIGLECSKVSDLWKNQCKNRVPAVK